MRRFLAEISCGGLAIVLVFATIYIFHLTYRTPSKGMRHDLNVKFSNWVTYDA